MWEIVDRDRWIEILINSKCLDMWRGSIRGRPWKTARVLLYLTKIDNGEECLKWLKENAQGRWHLSWHAYLEFENENDAMAFKMRWL